MTTYSFSPSTSFLHPLLQKQKCHFHWSFLLSSSSFCLPCASFYCPQWTKDLSKMLDSRLLIKKNSISIISEREWKKNCFDLQTQQTKSKKKPVELLLQWPEDSWWKINKKEYPKAIKRKKTMTEKTLLKETKKRTLTSSFCVFWSCFSCASFFSFCLKQEEIKLKLSRWDN